MAMTMRERIARAIANRDGLWDAEVQRVYGDLWAKEELQKAYDRADAALAELETPTDGMVEAACIETQRRAIETDYHDDVPLREFDDLSDGVKRDMRDVISHGLSAAIRAAKEGK